MGRDGVVQTEAEAEDIIAGGSFRFSDLSDYAGHTKGVRAGSAGGRGASGDSQRGGGRRGNRSCAGRGMGDAGSRCHDPGADTCRGRRNLS